MEMESRIQTRLADAFCSHSSLFVAGGVSKVRGLLRPSLELTNTNMADFEEDQNPFGDDDHEQNVPITPPPQFEHDDVPPETPAKATMSPGPDPPTPAYKGYPGLSPKTSFCCVRDEYLHSDDAEIQASKQMSLCRSRRLTAHHRLSTPLR